MNQPVGAYGAKFNNPAVLVQSWYPAARSSQVRRGKAKSLDLHSRRVVIYRDRAGAVHAMDARCPHFGADLRLGKVIRGGLQCSFHGMCFGEDGARLNASGSRFPCSDNKLAVYPVTERWGVIWVFNGPRPLFELPHPPSSERLLHLRLPSRRINCHPHLVIANGLDVQHYETLHGMSFSDNPRITIDQPYEVRLELRGRPRSRINQLLTGTLRGEMAGSFTTLGASLAWAIFQRPVKFYALFSGLPTLDGKCLTQTIFFLPLKSSLRFMRAAALMAMLLKDDARALNGICFTPNFSSDDFALRSFADVVNALEVW